MFCKTLILLTAAAAAFSSPTAHLFLIIGQSNSEGFNSGGHTAEDVSSPNIRQTSCCDNGNTNNEQCRLIEGQDPLHHYCDVSYLESQNIGFGMSFAREFNATIPEGDTIVLIPAGIGGTGFVDNVWTAYSGSGFRQALARLSSTLRILSDQYSQYEVSLDGILWHQGEADADVDTSVSDYLSKDLIPMINAWRNTSLIPISGPTVPFVVGNLVPSWVLDPNEPKRLGVFSAIQFLSQYVSYSAVTPSVGLVGDQQEGENPVHFSAPSQRNFGKRYFASWKAAQRNLPV